MAMLGDHEPIPARELQNMLLEIAPHADDEGARIELQYVIKFVREVESIAFQQGWRRGGAAQRRAYQSGYYL